MIIKKTDPTYAGSVKCIKNNGADPADSSASPIPCGATNHKYGRSSDFGTHDICTVFTFPFSQWYPNTKTRHGSKDCSGFSPVFPIIAVEFNQAAHRIAFSTRYFSTTYLICQGKIFVF